MSKNKKNVKIKKISNVRASGNNNTVDIRNLRELKINDETKIRANIYNYRKQSKKEYKIFLVFISMLLIWGSTYFIILKELNPFENILVSMLSLGLSMLLVFFD